MRYSCPALFSNLVARNYTMQMGYYNTIEIYSIELRFYYNYMNVIELSISIILYWNSIEMKNFVFFDPNIV